MFGVLTGGLARSVSRLAGRDDAFSDTLWLNTSSLIGKVVESSGKVSLPKVFIIASSEGLMDDLYIKLIIKKRLFLTIFWRSWSYVIQLWRDWYCWIASFQYINASHLNSSWYSPSGACGFRIWYKPSWRFNIRQWLKGKLNLRRVASLVGMWRAVDESTLTCLASKLESDSSPIRSSSCNS